MEKKVLAIVAGREITNEDVENVINGYAPEESKKMQNETVRRKILEQLVATRLFSMQAREEKLDETKEFNDLLEKLKDEVLGQMQVTNLIKDIKVTEKMERDFYRANEEGFVAPADVLAKHILVSSKEEALSIKKEIENGDLTFEMAASKYSTCPSKDRGGDLGYFTKGQLVPEFEEVAFKAEIDKITEPVATQFGYHLILVKDKREVRKLEFEVVRTQIHEKLIKEMQKAVYDDALSKMSEKYKVEYCG